MKEDYEVLFIQRVVISRGRVYSGARIMARISPKQVEIAGFLILLGAYAVSFFVDVRYRDAFTWMDPCQYFSFACDLLTGQRPVTGFEIPSIFPFLMGVPLAIYPSFAAALSINLASAFVLAAAIRGLCREVGIRWPLLVAACAFSSPLLIGLSRELYTEFTLSAMVAVQFLLWFRSEQFSRRRETVAFAILFAAGCLTKMTYPIYFAGPFLVEELFLLKQRNHRGTVRCLLAVGLPILAVVPLARVLFPGALDYYSSLGNTLISAMPFIGPRAASLDAAVYYPVQVWRTLLFLLAPLLLVPVLKFTRDRRRLILWAWFLVPMGLLTFEAVKEPRHVAPCVVPAILLIFAGITQIRAVRIRSVLYAVALALALTQYGRVTYHRTAAPYYLDKPSMAVELLDIMIEADPERGRFVDDSGRMDKLRWTYSRNLALTGFDSNMSLLYAWQFNPAVTYDLDLFEQAPDPAGWETTEAFEDLYLLTAFTLYNRRCLCPRYYRTLDRATVAANADFILAGRGSPGELAGEYPEHVFVKSLHARGKNIHVFRAASMPRPSYRSLFAEAFLNSRMPTDEDRAAIRYDLWMNAILRSDIGSQDASNLDATVPRRNIYWTGNTKRLQKMAARILETQRGVAVRTADR